MNDLGNRSVLAGSAAQPRYSNPRPAVSDHQHTQIGIQRGEQNANTNFYSRIIGAMQPPPRRSGSSNIIGVLNTRRFPTDQGSEPSVLITENVPHQMSCTRDMMMLMHKNSIPGAPLPLFVESNSKEHGVPMNSNYGASRGQYLMTFSNESPIPLRSISAPAELLNLGPRKEQSYVINPQDKCLLLHRGRSEGAAAPPVTVVLEGRSICQRICLEDHSNYTTFAQALRIMFADIASAGGHAFQIYNAGECNLANALPGYVIAYEDIEGDLLLAGDLSWKDFVRAAKRIRILPAKKPAGDEKGPKG